MAIASSCRENCRSIAARLRCTKEKEAKCYQDCLRDCDNAATQPRKDKSTRLPRMEKRTGTLTTDKVLVQHIPAFCKASTFS
jgi:hypothetical protein